MDHHHHHHHHHTAATGKAGHSVAISFKPEFLSGVLALCVPVPFCLQSHGLTYVELGGLAVSRQPLLWQCISMCTGILPSVSRCSARGGRSAAPALLTAPCKTPLKASWQTCASCSRVYHRDWTRVLWEVSRRQRAKHLGHCRDEVLAQPSQRVQRRILCVHAAADTRTTTGKSEFQHPFHQGYIFPWPSTRLDTGCRDEVHWSTSLSLRLQ